MIKYILLGLLWISPAHATTVADITQQLRCLVCEGQTIHESNADFAITIRDYVQTELEKGEKPAQILENLRVSYGDQILIKPPFKPATYGLWLGPILIIIIGAWIFIPYIRKAKK